MAKLRINYICGGKGKQGVHYKITGNGNPIVFLHGWGCSGNVFDPVVSKLCGYTRISVDFWGFGNSPMPPAEGLSVTDYANGVATLLHKLGVSNALVVGHSFGCRVGLVLAANYPNLVQGLLLVAPAGLRKFSFRRWCAEMRHKRTKRYAARGNERAKAKLQSMGSEDYQKCSPALKNTFVKVVRQDLSSYAKQVVAQTLVVNGNDDKQTPLSHAKRLCRLISNCQLAVIKGDHFAFFRTPVAFARCITLFAGQVFN